MRNFGLGINLGGLPFKALIIGLATVLLAGCSDSVERFSRNYNNPSDVDPVYTASLPKRNGYAYSSPRYRTSSGYQAPPEDVAMVDEQPITQSPKASVASPPVHDYNKPKLAGAPPAPDYSAPRGQAPVIANEQVSDSNTTPSAKATNATITVTQGMTLYSIAKANHLSVKELGEANNLTRPYAVVPGQVLKVPGVKHAVIPQVASSAPADAAPVVDTGDGTRHIVAKGDTLFSLGRKYDVPAFAIADDNGLAHDKQLTVGTSLKIPKSGHRLAAAKPAVPEVASDARSNDNADTPVAGAAPAPLALPKAKQNTKAASAPDMQDAAPPPADTRLVMRWPLRGKVISAFGSKPNGMKNEGINIAAPEGTKIQSAEAGVVAYAGNELKGYGNLVLIRHSGGYVTAYAHASQIMVKKGDVVKRGDVIALSGQTGAVQSPQLHFEVRKGATALDPSTFLNSNTATN